MSQPDFLTVDAFIRPPGGRIRWRRDLKRVLNNRIEGLRGSTVNYANNGTHSLAPALLSGGPGRFSLDSEIVRVKIDSESERNHWHGWAPRADGAKPLEDDEPMVAIVHGIIRRGRLIEFLRNNLHAASRAAQVTQDRDNSEAGAPALVTR